MMMTMQWSRDIRATRDDDETRITRSLSDDDDSKKLMIEETEKNTVTPSIDIPLIYQIQARILQYYLTTLLAQNSVVGLQGWDRQVPAF